MRGTHRIIFLLAVAASMLVVPTVDWNAPPAPAEVVALEVTMHRDAPGRYVGAVDGAAASVSAVLDGRTVEVRGRAADGSWSAWRELHPGGEHAPDPGTAEAVSARSDVSEPMWLGSADRVELRADGPGPVELEVVRLPGDRSYTASHPVAGAADALAVWPPIIPRYRWDPNGDCDAAREPRVASTARRIYVHHTVVFPHYAEDEADDVLRAVCLGHVHRRGFSDLGYNFVIDQYGRIYQGRQGGILQPVVGAHASGFNRGSIGIAIVGDFEEHRVPPAAVSALDQLVAWLADLHGIEPYEVSDHVSTGGATTRFEEGDVVALPTIVGHRDTGLDTACPGEHLYEYVRGGHLMAPRVRNILEAEYGWAATDREPPPAGEVKSVPPSAGRQDLRGEEGSVLGSVGALVADVTDAVGSRDPVEAVSSVVRGASVASSLAERRDRPSPPSRVSTEPDQ